VFADCHVLGQGESWKWGGGGGWKGGGEEPVIIEKLHTPWGKLQLYKHIKHHITKHPGKGGGVPLPVSSEAALLRARQGRRE
jgi:hypothetical protein